MALNSAHMTYLSDQPQNHAVGMALSRPTLGERVNEWAVKTDQAVTDWFKGTSAGQAVEQAHDKLPSKVKEALKNLSQEGTDLDDLVDEIAGLVFEDSGPSYSSVKSAQNSGSTVDYLNADLAKHYGMDTQSAYSEALQNTAYQRAVADLKAAGLNPVLAAGSLSPAGSFVAGDTLSGGSGSGSSGRVSSGKSGQYALSSNLYNKLGVAANIVGALVGAKLNPKNPVVGAFTGMSVSKPLIQGVAQLFTK